MISSKRSDRGDLIILPVENENRPCHDRVTGPVFRISCLNHCFYKYLISKNNLFNSNLFLLIKVKTEHISFL